MATNQSGTGRPEYRRRGEAPGQDGVKHSAFALLKDEEDRSVLRLWRESLSQLDQRYESKILLTLVTLAMTDEQFRSRLINDTEGVLREVPPERQSDFDVLGGATLRFLENTQNTLNVILPPRAGGMIYTLSGDTTYRPPRLREALRSRTSQTPAGLLWDDFDIGDWYDAGNFGNAEYYDSKLLCSIWSVLCTSRTLFTNDVDTPFTVPPRHSR